MLVLPKLYYHTETGEMIEFIGYRTGDVRETAKEEEYSRYPSLQQYSIDAIDYIKTEKDFNPYQFTSVKVVNGDIITTAE
jgi:hypothetical protein